MFKLILLVVVVLFVTVSALTPGPHQLPLIASVLGFGIVNAIKQRNSHGS